MKIMSGESGKINNSNTGEALRVSKHLMKALLLICVSDAAIISGSNIVV